MKRAGYLFERIVDLDNIKLAIKNSARNKKNRRGVRRALRDVDGTARDIQSIIVEGFEPSEYRSFYRSDPASGKRREILQPKYYPDQVVHWAILQVLEPVFLKGMYHYSCGSVPGRGVHYGKRAVERWIRKDARNTKWVLQMDIEKFYQNVGNEFVLRCLNRKIKDRKTLALLESIVVSSPGLPIGNVLSQWLSNFVLEELDHLIKQEFGGVYYIRYVDDLVIFGPNKKHLHEIRKRVSDYLEGVGLRLKSSWQVYPLNKRALDFLGFRFYRGKTVLRKKLMYRIVRKFSKVKSQGYLTIQDARAIASYWGWVKHSDSYWFYQTRLRPLLSVKRVREYIATFHYV